MKTKQKIWEDAAAVLNELEKHAGIIWTFGNGGSASIANHMACDWMKATSGHFRVISLSSNGSVLSAIGNDAGYDRTAVDQLRWLAPSKGPVVLISASGMSPNVVEAAKYCQVTGIPIIAFSGNAMGRRGGRLREMATVSVHCKSRDYGVIEDYHSQVMHEVLRQWLARVK